MIYKNDIILLNKKLNNYLFNLHKKLHLIFYIEIIENIKKSNYYSIFQN